MSLIFGLLPVVGFLICLFLLDSFKLVKLRSLLLCILWGILSAGLSYFVNTLLSDYFNLGFESLSRYFAPFIEEFLKFSILLIFIRKKLIGFIIDAAIYGFAIGTGFALIENLYYFFQLGEGFHPMLAIVRGFGTAIMHGGTISICAIIIIEGIHRSDHILRAAIPGITIAVFIHGIFNQFILNPMFQTLLILTLLPLTFYFIMDRNIKQLQNWLEIEFSNEVDMLRMIRIGKFRDTKSGNYLASLRQHFPPEVVVDMYCLISLFLELSIKAKRNIMLRENGFPPIIEPDLKDKLNELQQLRKQIGKAGEMALRPLVRMSYKELWKLNQLQV
jgi:protease PrsW